MGKLKSKQPARNRALTRFPRSIRGAAILLAVLMTAWPLDAGEHENLPPVSDWIWESDADGITPDLTYPITYVLAYHTFGISVLGSLEQDSTNFSGPSTSNIEDAFTRGPKFDDDEWYFNYVAHPLWGSETYLRARSQGLDEFSSFLFSTASSVVWEFGFESPFQRPSYQDLLITSTTGFLLGEFRFRLKRHLVEADTHTSNAIAVLIDPLQSFTEQVGRLFGQDWSEPAYNQIVTNNDPYAPKIIMNVALIENKPGVFLSCSTTF